MLESEYHKSALARVMKEVGVDSPVKAPRFEKVCLSVGLGGASSDSKLLASAVEDLSLIAGQKAVVTVAKKSISSFKLRKGFPVGCRVTLRKRRMFDFINRLLYMALPDQKDFKGFTMRNFDGHGNMAFGLTEHIVFPEVDFDKTYRIIGMNVVVVTTASTDQLARILLSCYGFPFRD
ncbi:50S ribosomal protein L5 [Neorickettsia sennetsu]|uniref:Large ribosomal subunit protein uL5 n=1 Tax=Ehrlichia sennetsu (strain ATCC VR-367 / Miyayama) TaxID=222891 RepID=RL5_EHRS3|nr:50S ribosomal protein L5 [Neorickettsia sennetsu]Q2GEC7.1 RecName: Full=Large ribosomal subunit protein uL5; AltName: Full=50S ribosomal protein L5 [Neorickettsia sennetsu str. Miyayama]ABD45857.1 ribosomal protein L5 [Neorickettsia sennetsu str. Miyayama]